METSIERADGHSGPPAAAESGYRAGVTALAMMSDTEFETRLRALKSGQSRLQQIHRTLMVEGVDYGTIPGTPKPTLFKPGAEKLCQFYGLVPYFAHEITYGDGHTAPPINVISRCDLRVGSDRGPSIAQSTGACSSFEKKYRYRRGERACPACGVMGAMGFSRERREHYCWNKKGGCGAKFPEKAPEIVNQPQGDIDNPDPFELLNTIIKMADKRALVGCALMATATSGLYTQDLDDLPPDQPHRETVSEPNQANNQPDIKRESAPVQPGQCAECKAPDGKPHTRKCSLYEGKSATPTAVEPAANGSGNSLQAMMSHTHGLWSKWCKAEGHEPGDADFLRNTWGDLAGRQIASRNDLTADELRLIADRLNAMIEATGDTQ